LNAASWPNATRTWGSSSPWTFGLSRGLSRAAPRCEAAGGRGGYVFPIGRPSQSTGHTGRDPGRAYGFVARPADPEDRQCRLVRVEPQRLAQLAGGRRAVQQLAQRMYEEV